MKKRSVMRIAALIASFNRKEKTLRCIDRLLKQSLPDNVTIDIHLTDDASSDGTADAVKSQFPNANVYHGTGQLYWAGGMRNSWKNALSTSPNFYLLINDDVFLFEEAINNLLENSAIYQEKHGHQAIFVGATIDDQERVSYGGRKLHSKYRPQYELMHPNETQQVCDLGDGNIMFIPAAVVEAVGILSEEWTHGIADHDYCYRTKKAGFEIILIPGIHGKCNFDKGKGWKSGDVKLSERLKYLYSPTGLQYKEYLRYIKKYYPYDLPASFLKLWVKTLFPFVYDRFKKDLR